MAAKKMVKTTNPTGRKNTKDTSKSSDGKKRSDFALPSRGMFPMNTAGRRSAAPGLAARAQKAGTITAAEKKKVDRAARKKS